MRKFLMLFFLLAHILANAQWQWAKSIGSISDDVGGILIDENGNSYCYGNFQGTCYFQTDTLLANGCWDYFLAKYDSNGNELWVKQFGSLNDNCSFYAKDRASGFFIDKYNHCIFAGGRFTSNITIDGKSLNSNIGSNAFLAKFDLNGTCNWLKKATSLTGVEVMSMVIANDSIGNVLWSGILDKPGKVDTVSLDMGAFLSKFDMNGNLLWAKSEIDGAEIVNIVLTSDAMYFTGVTRDDTIRFDTLMVQRQYAVDPFVAKTDLTGGIKWAKVFGGTSDDYGVGLALDENRNIYVSGKFYDNFSVDSVIIPSNNYKYDMYLLKLDSNANLKWLKQSHANGVYGARAGGITYQNGYIYLTGSFSGNASFGNINVTSNSINQDMFVAQYDTSGNSLDVYHFGEAQGFGLQIDSIGNIYSSGSFKGMVNVGGTTLTSHGGYDVFIAKHDAITGIPDPRRTTNNQLYIHANPNAGRCNITVPDEFVHEKNLVLSIYNSSGKLIQQKKLEMNEGKIKLSLEAEAKGLYNAVLSNGLKSYSGKIVFE